MSTQTNEDINLTQQHKSTKVIFCFSIVLFIWVFFLKGLYLIKKKNQLGESSNRQIASVSSNEANSKPCNSKDKEGKNKQSKKSDKSGKDGKAKKDDQVSLV